MPILGASKKHDLFEKVHAKNYSPKITISNCIESRPVRENLTVEEIVKYFKNISPQYKRPIVSWRKKYFLEKTHTENYSTETARHQRELGFV